MNIWETLRNKNTIWMLLLWSSIHEHFSDTSQPMPSPNLGLWTTKSVCFSLWEQLQLWCVLASIHTCMVVTARVSFSMLEETSRPPLWSWDGAAIRQEEKQKSGACSLSPSVEDDRQVKVSTALIQSDSLKRCLRFWGATQVAERGKKAAMTSTGEGSSAGSGGKGVYF